MLGALFGIARPLIFLAPPEDAHEAVLASLETGLYPRATEPDDATLAVEFAGLSFPNPIGVAAGFDKDARVPDAVLGMGCGFAEIGTVTPRPQTGNPRPRVFRLVEDRALINRLGFNNGGHAGALARLGRRPRRGVVGVNIGANKDTEDRAADYVAGIAAFGGVASYFMVNVSSPNTPGLRDLLAPEALDDLLARVMAARAAAMANGQPHRPVFVKLSPDMADGTIAPIVERLLAHRVDGVAVSNTTLARPRLRDARAFESGGLSGRPLFHRSTVMLARVHEASEGKIPLIGVGGVDGGAAALAKIEAGASLIQLYTGLVYEGPGLIQTIKQHLLAAARRAGLTRVAQLTGRRAREWAAKPLD